MTFGIVLSVEFVLPDQLTIEVKSHQENAALPAFLCCTNDEQTTVISQKAMRLLLSSDHIGRIK